MKKLCLKNAKSMLSRKEMKAINGGYGDTDCTAAKFNAYVDATRAGFSSSDATGISYSVYFYCMSL